MFDSPPEPLEDLSLMLGAGEPMASSGGASEEKPSRIVFGTIVRAAPIEKGGELVVLDWEEKEIVETVPMRPRDPTIGEDPDPRGNARGCRGVRWLDGEIIAATYHTLERYDSELRRVGAINGRLMAGLHEIGLTERETVWVSSTAIDAAVEYNLQSNDQQRALWPREMPSLQTALDLRPLPIDKSADNRLRFLDSSERRASSHLHLNAVDEHGGSVYALCNSQASVINLTDERVAIHDERLMGAHNLRIEDDGTVLINDTYGRAIQFFDLETGERDRSIDLTQYRWVRNLIRGHLSGYWGRRVAIRLGIMEDVVARPLFVRGLMSFGKYLFVGVSPAAILQIDRTTGDLVDAYQYADDIRVCVHGLDVIPPDQKQF